MIKARIKSEMKALTSGELTRLVNTATYKALNGTAFDIQKSTRGKIPTWVNLTKRFLPSQVVVDMGNAKTQEATVGFSKKVDFADLLEMGGTRRPKSGQHLAVPTREVKRGKAGGITKANRPRQVLNKKNSFKKKSDAGKLGIYKRVRRTIKLLYTLLPITQYNKKHLNFVDNAERVFRVKYHRNLSQKLDRELKKLRIR